MAPEPVESVETQPRKVTTAEAASLVLLTSGVDQAAKTTNLDRIAGVSPKKLRQWQITAMEKPEAVPFNSAQFQTLIAAAGPDRQHPILTEASNKIREAISMIKVCDTQGNELGTIADNEEYQQAVLAVAVCAHPRIGGNTLWKMVRDLEETEVGPNEIPSLLRDLLTRKIQNALLGLLEPLIGRSQSPKIVVDEHGEASLVIDTFSRSVKELQQDAAFFEQLKAEQQQLLLFLLLFDRPTFTRIVKLLRNQKKAS